MQIVERIQVKTDERIPRVLLKIEHIAIAEVKYFSGTSNGRNQELPETVLIWFKTGAL